MELDADNTVENKKYVFAVYILQALSFVLGVTAILGLIINYIKDDDVKGSWLASHFLWQKRTFWYGLLWIVVLRFCLANLPHCEGLDIPG